MRRDRCNESVASSCDTIGPRGRRDLCIFFLLTNGLDEPCAQRPIRAPIEMTDACRERSFTFSVRAMLMFVAAIALVFAFWTSLPSLSPRWADLLSRIDAASAVPVRGGLHQGKREAFYDWPRPTTTTYIQSALLLFVFYLAKRLIVMRLESNDFRGIAYVALVTVVLPFIYLNWTAWPAINVYFLANWIYMPTAILTVPTVSLALDMRCTNQQSWSRYTMRSLIEIFVILPIWWIAWGIVMVFSGLIWM